MLGLERGTVELVPYRPEWETLAREEMTRLRESLGDTTVELYHVGSTAIRGTAAKPVIDLLAVVETIDETAPYVSRLEAVGYEFRGRDPAADRLFFAKGPAHERTHYLSVTERDSPCHTEQIAFRDALRESPELAEEYVTLKRELASAYPDDRSSYTDGKADFIRRVLDRPSIGE